ncbi:MAG TPA: heavy metal-responsive transcriptional regulator [Gemmatimonadaceae bacterium]|nr:heavy metal-responsive transcriptional regulator [Gemmatimonadaceae bacterium]
MAIELEENETLTIGELAGAVGVNVQTVRYYERRGLLPKPKRRASGYREYMASDIARLEFIRRAQALGFTLSEIEQLLALRVDPRTTPGDVHRAVEEKIEAVEAKISDLTRIASALRKMAASCHTHGPLGECPFLEALESEDSSVLARRSHGNGAHGE